MIESLRMMTAARRSFGTIEAGVVGRAQPRVREPHVLDGAGLVLDGHEVADPDRLRDEEQDAGDGVGERLPRREADDRGGQRARTRGCSVARRSSAANCEMRDRDADDDDRGLDDAPEEAQPRVGHRVELDPEPGERIWRRWRWMTRSTRKTSTRRDDERQQRREGVLVGLEEGLGEQGQSGAIGHHGRRAPGRQHGRWADSWAVAWRALLASRVVVLVAGALAAGSARPRPAPHGLRPSRAHDPRTAALGDLLAGPARALGHASGSCRIAHDGYGDGAREPRSSRSIRCSCAVGGTVTGGEPLLAGIAISTACARWRSPLLHRLVALELGAGGRARRRARDRRFMPMSFFLSAVYSESLFLMLSVGAVYAARTDRWAWAGVLGGLPAATRSAGVVLLVPLVLLWWDAQGPRRVRDLAWLALVPARASARTASTCGRSGGDPLAPFAAQDVWFREFAGPFGGVVGRRRGGVGGRAPARCPGRATPVFFTQAGGDPFVVARHNIELFAWLVVGARRRSSARCGGCRSRTSPTSSPPSRCRSPTRSAPAAHVAATLPARAVPARHLPSQPGRRSGAWRGPVLADARRRSGSRCTRRSSRRWHWVA